jgi:Ca2+-transporting ATPase
MLQTINTFHKAGIQVKMITGDYAETALAIARQVGLDGHYEVLTGEEIVRLTEDELRKKVKDVNVFARMYPEAKLKVIEVLRENGEVVAMTGDGVNDGPALKAAHIGIAMGQRGSEVAKEAASLILVDDDLSHLVEAVAQGRKIYDNLKKAIRYIVSIHIPIILIVILPLLLKWRLTGIFSPIHIIFLELIMGPTCSIIYENEPMESGAMERPPRKLSSTFLSLKQLLVSIVQGLFITAACLGIGYYYMEQQYGDTTIRSVIFVTLLFCNIFLTLVNRSFRQTIFATFKNKNRLLPIIITISFLGIISLFYFPYIRQLFGCANIGAADMLCCAGVAFTGTCWIELVKISGSKFLDK